MNELSKRFNIAGIEPLTMIDYPGCISTVIFSQGCNLRCRFCYNKNLLKNDPKETISFDFLNKFLFERRNFIEAVVLSGGEPCMQPGLIELLTVIKKMGYLTGIHTNGYYPDEIETALNNNLLNFVAVDFKAPFSKYTQITGLENDEHSFSRLVDILNCSSDVETEFRTTVHPELLSINDLIEMAQWLNKKKVTKFVLQQFKHGNAYDYTLSPARSGWIDNLSLLKIKTLVPIVETRGDCAATNLDTRINSNYNENLPVYHPSAN